MPMVPQSLYSQL